MYKTRLITSLQSFSRKELSQFHAFVSSPFYNKNPRVTKLLELLAPHAPDFDSPAIHREKIYTKLYPKTAYNEQKLRLETSALFQLLKEFLATKAFQNDPWQKQIYLLGELRNRDNERVFQSEIKSLENTLNQSEELNAQAYFAQYRINAEKNVFFGKQFLRKYDPSLQNKIDNLDLYYLAIKLKESCEMINRQRIMKPPYEIRMTDELIKVLEKEPFYLETSPLIAVYYKILQMLTEPQKSNHFYELTELLEKHYSAFEKHEARGMYKHAQNYCIRQINQGNEPFLEEFFMLYQQLLEKKLILINDHISPTDFKNIVTVGLRLKRYDWVRTFLAEYGPLIHSEHQESIYNYNRASFLVSTGEHKEAIQLLQTVKFTDPYIQISARQLLLRIFYDQDDINTLLYHLDAFIIFLRRNKNIAQVNRQNLLNYLKLTKRIALLRDKKPTLATSELEEQLNSLTEIVSKEPNTSERKWLMEKIDALR